MKRSDLKVGEMYLDRRGNFVIVLDADGWSPGRWGRPPFRGGRGVAVAYCSWAAFDTGGEEWRPSVRQLSQINQTVTREGWRAQNKARQERIEVERLAAEQRRAETARVVERLRPYEIEVPVTWSTNGVIQIKAADLAKLLDLLDASELRGALD